MYTKTTKLNTVRVFTEDDWNAFAGAQCWKSKSGSPFIAEMKIVG